MLNYIWAVMVLISIIFAAVNGRLDMLSLQAFSAAKSAVNTTISLIGAMCFWSGMLKIAEQCKITSAISTLLKPIIKIIFPSVPTNSAAAEAIVSNMSANMLGMGNAATPFGIKAMHELDALNKHSSYASNAMCMFVVVNTASIQLIPTTMISLLSSNGAAKPFDIILPTLICSFISLIVGVCVCKIMSNSNKSKAQKRDRL